MRLTSLADACRAAGLTVVETPGWQHRGAELGQVGAVLAHHTGSSPRSTDEAVCRLLRDGRPDLPGPLAQVGLDRQGRVHLIAAGKANHAGAGSWCGVTGNSRAVGVEAFNDGHSEPWPAPQLQAWDRLNAVLLRLLNLPAGALCAHREWAPTRKTDPHSLDMTAMRARAAALLEGDDPMTPDQEAALARIDRRVEEAHAALARIESKTLPLLLAKTDITPQEIAAAIPAGLAADVVAALGDRLKGVR